MYNQYMRCELSNYTYKKNTKTRTSLSPIDSIDSSRNSSELTTERRDFELQETSYWKRLV